ncbi:MAG: tyrosine-type recombinase/integrase [Blastocatellia bacterium]
MAKPYIVQRKGKKGETLYYVLIPYKDSQGKWKQKWERAENKSEANRRIVELLDTRDTQGASSFENRDTVNQYLDKWLEKRAKIKVAQSTYEDYSGLLRLHVRQELGKLPLSKLRREHIQDFVNGMRLNEYSPSTIRFAYAALSGALKDAVKDGILTINPAHEIDLPKKTRKKPKALSPQEARNFLEACSKNKLGLIFEFALFTGMRPEEYLALRWADIDFEKYTATINRTIRWGKWNKYEYYFGKGKTEKSKRTIPISKDLAQKLSAHRKRQLEQKMKMGEKYQNLDLVFATKLGTPLPLDRLRSRNFKAILKDAGLPPMRIYDLRHSFATLSLNVGGELKLKTISDLLGHSNISTTEIHLHPDDEMKREVTDGLVSVIFAKRSG